MKRNRRRQKNKIPFTARKSSWLIVLAAGMLLIIFLPRTIILAKYASELFDYTGVTAGDFHFTSDYLAEDTRIQTVYSWQSDAQSTRMEIRNYSNALRFNDEDTDVWYYFDVEIYEQKEEGQDVISAKEEELQENTGAQYTVAVEKASGASSSKASESENEEEEEEEEDSVLEGLTLYTYYDGTNYYPCVCLPGIEGKGDSAFSRKKGTQYLTVDITDFGDNAEEKDQRVSVSVHTITADKLGNIYSVEYSKWSSTASSNRTKMEDVSADGVYQVDLAGAVCFMHTADVQDVTARYETTEDDSRLHHYNLYCTSVTGSGSRNVLVYYDSDYFDFSADSKVSTIQYQPETGEPDTYTKYRYFQTQIQANNKTELSLYTPWNGAGTEESGDALIKEYIATAALGKMSGDKKLAPTNRAEGMADGWVLWFEVEGQDSETLTTLTFLTEYCKGSLDKTISMPEADLKENEEDPLTWTGSAYYSYDEAYKGEERTGQQMNRVRLCLGDSYSITNTGTITVGTIDKTTGEVKASETITVSGGSAGDIRTLSTVSTYTLGENEEFFIGAPGDTLKIRMKTAAPDTEEDLEEVTGDYHCRTCVTDAETGEKTLSSDTGAGQLSVDFGMEK